ncbi:MAG: NTP transferase domain-containing protein [Sedimentisphaerales bacterium]|nr:NTP transferase domain-containing protein [Sedimentisphaerales bacterium]
MNYAVIMAGGSGQRLWPLSRQSLPKQIIELHQGKSLLRHCVDRIQDIFSADRILVVTNAEYAHVVKEHLPELPQENILGEPIGRDTANAIGLAATVLHKRNPDAFMAVFSADHIIEPIEPLQKAVKQALKFLKSHPQALFTFGIKATSAHTGFGYLKRGENSVSKSSDIFPVEAFKEKPNKSTAHKYLRSGKYCWNSGMFVWRVDTILENLGQFLPHNADRFAKIGQTYNTDAWDETLQKEFPEMEKISIDFAVMEHAKHVYMCELDCHWVDVGSFTALADTIGTRDDEDNVTAGQTLCKWYESSRNIAISHSPDHIIATIGVEDLIIVHTDDATLICRKNDADSIKDLLADMREDNNFRRYL